MRGIDLYKAILEDESYKDKSYTDGTYVYDIKSTGDDSLCIYQSSVSIFYSSTPTKINKFFRTELEEVLCPMPWQECVQKWAENSKKYIVKVVTKNDESLYGDDIAHLQDEYRFGISYEDILEGKWYLIEKQTS